MALDLRLDERGQEAIPAGGPPPPAGAPDKSAHALDALWQAHQMLLHRLEEMQRQHSEAQERAMRQGFANIERHSAETAARYRTLVDELARRVTNGPGSMAVLERIKFGFNVLIVGVVLGAMLVMWAPNLWKRVQPQIAPALVMPAETKAPPAASPAASRPVRPKAR